MSLKDTSFRECNGEVEGRLSAEPCEQTFWPLTFDDAFNHLNGERLQIYGVSDGWVGHDRRRI